MCAAVAPETVPEHRPLRFVVVGIGVTLLYAVLAAAFTMGENALYPAAGSLLAYSIASVVAYAGHKHLTFGSDGSHRFEAPRFAILTLLGLAVSFALPAVLSETVRPPVPVLIALTCVLTPLVNYLVMRYWVFARRRARRETT